MPYFTGDRGKARKADICFRVTLLAGTCAAALAFNGAAQAQSITVTGDYLSGTGQQPSGANWSSFYNLHVGFNGAGMVTVESGAILTFTGGAHFRLGENAPDGNGSGVITGAGSRLVVSGQLVSGRSGRGDLVVADGAFAQGGAVIIGQTASAAGTATVTGAGSKLRVNNRLLVGSSGSGRLDILNGGSVESIGGDLGGTSGHAVVSGTGSEWINSDGLVIGRGANNSLLIEDGGLVRGTYGRIAENAGVSSVVTVTGAGSRWINNDYLSVGTRGVGTLVIENGGFVENTFSLLGQEMHVGAEGHVRVSGAGSLWRNTAHITIGSGAKGSLLIEDGGRVESERATISNGTFSDGEVTVTGAGSTWYNLNNLGVGASSKAKLTIADGGLVENGNATIGSTIGESEAIVTGAGSTWRSRGSLSVGLAQDARLSVSAGGSVISASGRLGLYAGLATVTVSGAGSSWRNDGSLYIGEFGSGLLQVEDGGLVTATTTTFGYGSGNGTVMLSGSAGARGALETGQVSRTGGMATMRFDGGLLRLTGNQANLFAGFSAGAVSFDAAGGLIDTQDFTVASAQAIAGSGGLTKLGSGTLALSGTSSFTGATEVAAGTLNVNGVLASAVTVNSAATLSGAGTIGGMTLETGGILSPGNSIGTLTATGDASFAAGSIYIVEIEAPDRADLLKATGRVTIDGGGLQITKLSAEADYRSGQTYTIIEAEGGVVRNGDFDFVNPFLFLDAEVEYGADYVDIVLKRNAGRLGAVAGTYNQRQAASGLERLGDSGDALAVYNQLLLMTDPADAARAFDMASGEVHASMRHVDDLGSRLFNHTLRWQGAAGLGQGAAGTKPRGAWASWLGDFGEIDGDGNAARLKWRQNGIAGGYEDAIDIGSGEAVAGFGFGYLRSHGEIDARLSEFDGDALHIGGYGAWRDGAWTASGALSYAANHISTERGIVFGAIDREARADYWTHSLRLSGEIAHGFALGADTVLSPLASFDASRAGHGGFSEKGADALDVAAGSSGWGRFDTGLGLALRHEAGGDSGRVTIEGRALWEYAFGGTRPEQSLSLAGSPAGYSVRGPATDRNRLRLDASLGWQLSERAQLRLRYEGLVSGAQARHAGSFGLKVGF